MCGQVTIQIRQFLHFHSTIEITSGHLLSDWSKPEVPTEKETQQISKSAE